MEKNFDKGRYMSEGDQVCGHGGANADSVADDEPIFYGHGLSGRVLSSAINVSHSIKRCQRKLMQSLNGRYAVKVASDAEELAISESGRLLRWRQSTTDAR